MVNAIKTGSLTGITDRVENVLETVTVPKYPVIEEIKNCMKENGAMNALMSGSGPTVFGIFGAKDKDAAQQAKKMIQDKGLANQIYIVQPFNQDI
jgi:4-diphosphocytidyl-2-C-methyl-D-erythritol kinase